MVKTAFLSREPALKSTEFVGRQAEIEWIADKLSRQIPQNCNLVGEPRSGKTSLLYQVYERQIGLPPGENGLYLWLRLAELPQHDSLSFWRLLAKKLCKAQVKAGLLPEMTIPTDNVDDLFDALDDCLETLLEEAGLERLVVLIDDFDFLVHEQGIGKRDLDWLRALATRYGRSLAFVISSTDSLVKLTDPLTGPADVSPFANLFHNFQLGLLDRTEAESLCRQAAEIEQVPFSDGDVAFLLTEAGRHPDLLKIACGYLLTARREGIENTASKVTGDVRLDDRVRWLSLRLLQRCSTEETALLHQIAANQPVSYTILLNHLIKLGLVEMRGEQPTLFSEAFGYWVRQEIEAVAGAVVNGGETAPSAGLGQTVTPTTPFFNHFPDKRQVKIEGQIVDLTRLENRLLIYLSQRMNQVCTTQELLNNVWGSGKTEAVVEKGINRLRKKIEQDPQRPRYILSARGEGYILRD
ncbi:MAG: winged helix-turn-helix domain-containing protein [Ardenticatenaceae bacterium]|nr:winged helix-turn-helix domain-containing protein [Ardenticatenaceae bacterium]MCB9446586.1 winged helix-turn-helix domain-containing protein [Ardenticatenaceae bacterium]